MYKQCMLLTAVVLLMCTAAIAPARPSQEPASSPSAKTPSKTSNEVPAKVKKLYELDCAMCHGETGDGKTDLAKDMQLNMLDWSDNKTLANKSDQELFDTIRKGKGKMPPEEGARAKDDEVRSLVVLIRKMGKEQSAAAPAPADAPAPAATPAPATPPAPNK
jgi:cytochrome c5